MTIYHAHLGNSFNYKVEISATKKARITRYHTNAISEQYCQFLSLSIAITRYHTNAISDEYGYPTKWIALESVDLEDTLKCIEFEKRDERIPKYLQENAHLEAGKIYHEW